ncbi:MAG: hypothetical protein AB202_00575 [Parcubacteria bacterium C7867-007]|nr:MAG: hypothetical protein AB202_00575 [Parcubacteria bacterium C7867-007]
MYCVDNEADVWRSAAADGAEVIEADRPLDGRRGRRRAEEEPAEVVARDQGLDGIAVFVRLGAPGRAPFPEGTRVEDLGRGGRRGAESKGRGGGGEHHLLLHSRS